MGTEYLTREQTAIKHFALRKYLEAAALILGGTWPVTYIDTCSGPWESTCSDFSDTSFGIAIDVFRSSISTIKAQGKLPSFSAVFIEENPESYAKLHSYTNAIRVSGLSCETHCWDFSARLDEIVSIAKQRRGFTFTFIDPTGWKLVELATIEKILRIAPGEVLINFMSSFLTRFIHDDATDLSGLLGNDFRTIKQLTTHEQEAEMVRRYCEAVRRAGNFRYVCSLPIMKPDTDSIHFYLIYATRNEKGIRVFKEVEKRTEIETHVVRAEVQSQKRIESGGTLDLFAPDVLYREKRYQQILEKNRTLAKQAIWALIGATPQVSYQECWSEALQFAGVYESTLRHWLDSWEEERKIRIRGRKFPKEKLKTKSEHYITEATKDGNDD